MDAENQRALQRGACPSLWTPMESGDGLLVRVRGGRGARGLRAADLRALARLASAHGNGWIELTRRGRLQLRGVRVETLGALQVALVELGLAERSAARERSAALITNPYSGLSRAVADLDAPARDLERALAGEPACERLSDKFGVVLDSGFAFGDIGADIHVDVNVDAAAFACIHAASEGGWSLLGECAVPNVAEVVLELCRALAAAGEKTRMRAFIGKGGLEPLRERVEAAFARREGVPPLRAAAMSQPHGSASKLEVPASAKPANEQQRANGNAGSNRRDAGDHSTVSPDQEHVLSREPQLRAHSEPEPLSSVQRELGAPPLSEFAQANEAAAANTSDDASKPHLALAQHAHPPRPALGFHSGIRSWLELGIPFGAGTGELWKLVAELAERFGDGEIRFTPSRRVLICGVPERDRDAALRIAADAGLIIDARDPLLRTVACPGAPACSSAHGETRALARELAPLLAAGESLHVSGCAKGCAHSGACDVVLVRDPRGLALGLAQTASEAAGGPILAADRVRARFMQPRSAAAKPSRDILAADPSREIPEQRARPQLASTPRAADVRARAAAAAETSPEIPEQRARAEVASTPRAGAHAGSAIAAESSPEPRVVAVRNDAAEAAPSGLAQEPKTEQARHPATPV